MRLSLADAARPELSKVISAHEKIYLNINGLQGLFVAIKTKITFFCANLRDKNAVENIFNPNEDTYFRVKRKRMAFSRYPEICHEKVMFQSLKNILSYLESFQDQIATHGFIFL